MWKPLLAAVLIWIVWRWLKPVFRPTNRPVNDATEARAILGVPPGADEPTIRAAHRRLVLGVHPDRGGSADLTRRVNAARDLLLRETR